MSENNYFFKNNYHIMRNFKLIKFYYNVLIIFTFFFILASCNREDHNIQIADTDSIVENRSVCPNYVDILGCQGQYGASTNFGTLIYEGCSIPFYVNGISCSWGIYYSPPVIDWNSVFSNIFTQQPSKCTDLANKIMGLSIQGNHGELNNVLLDIKKKASLYAQTLWIEYRSKIDPNFYRCEEGVEPQTFSVITQESNCTMFCIKKLSGNGFVVAELICGQSCCTRNTPFCVVSPGVIQYGVPTYGDPTPCVDNWILNVSTCYEGSTTLGICNAACSKI
jgi:hypothetical protein